jgi:hypothetical protein
MAKTIGLLRDGALFRTVACQCARRRDGILKFSIAASA